MTFHVGQKVVCIDGGEWHPLDGRPAPDVGGSPVKGGVYTIAVIDVDCDGTWLNLIELHRECGWDATRFRPVADKKTDISIFTAMLNPDRVMAPALNKHDSILNQP